MNEPAALHVEGLAVSLGSGAEIVSDVSFGLARGEVLGLVGESGSGKTTVALSALGYARPGARITRGRVAVLGTDMLGVPESARARRRGSLIAYVPQDPSTALNPSLRVEVLLSEMLRAHAYAGDWAARTAAVLAKVGLPSDRRFRRRFPHQLSGGQQQRLAIAMALSCEPAVLVMDEPTTGLDVVTQALVLGEVRRLVSDTGVAILYVSHDLAVVAELAHRIAVMYAGRIVEEGPAETLVTRPRHPYTLGLIESIPDHHEPRALRGIMGAATAVVDRPEGCAFAPRCALASAECRSSLPELQEFDRGHLVRCVHVARTPPVTAGVRRGPESSTGAAPLLDVRELTAVHGARGVNLVAASRVSFSIGAHECVALVGESGSGKTTIARCIAGLHPLASGAVHFDGLPLAPLARERPRETRRRIQIVFQNPYDSLNPKQTVAQSLARPLTMFDLAERSAVAPRVAELLARVQLPAALASRYPPELSGGERQRVAIARALAPSPQLLVCDEVTSALDVSVQAVVLELLAHLRRELGLALLFISHDLGVVATIADRVVVLEHGTVREQGPVAEILAHPHDAYTRSLIDAAPSLPRHESAVGQLLSPSIGRERDAV